MSSTEEEVKELVERLHGGSDLNARFEDQDFPADSSSLGAAVPLLPSALPHTLHAGVFQNDDQFEWHSLYVMCDGSPELFVDGAEPDDVVAGELNDGWFLTALSLVATRGPLLRWLFVNELSMPLHGLYTIRFWVDGEWKLVVVDDRMPCAPGTHTPVTAAPRSTALTMLSGVRQGQDQQ